MHHLYPLAKGDPLCPLGFHPQVRWPTRCKRCFRDYKEHGGKRRDDDLRRDDTTASTPSLSWNSRESDSSKRRSWVSSSNLSEKVDNNRNDNNDFNNPSSWISTPDLANLEDDTQAVTTVSIKLPKRRPKSFDSRTGITSSSSSSSSTTTTATKTTSNNAQNNNKNFIENQSSNIVSDSFTIKKAGAVFEKTDSLATRAKKLKAIKENEENRRTIEIKEVKTISEEPTNHDVQFLIQVKTKPSTTKKQDDDDIDDDAVSLAGTETTDTTLVDTHENELREQLESLKKELETTKSKCDRLEREKSDILLRRLAAMDTTTSKISGSEVLKLQKKCNELQQQLEDYKDDKKSLSLKVKELEEELDQRPTAQQAQKIADELRSKLLAAETLCEELMDENEDIKKELREMEEQMDEMQDNFREDQAIEYTSLKKELDQTTKNCRILSFKLRKAERKAEQLENEKNEAEKKLKDVSGGHEALTNLEKIKKLEQELKVSNEVSLRLQKELDEANQKLNKVEENSKVTKKKAPMLGSIGKLPSGDGKVSRESLTRGGSQDDPAQLLRDLQNSMEREADLRSQLKFAEEEAQNLRKKLSRIEDDNESLVLQLKKMATRARSRKLSPTNTRLTPESTIGTMEKGDISDDEDPTEMKLQLELSEQEAGVLRRKVEDLEMENHKIKTKNKELQEKLSTTKITPSNRRTLNDNDNKGSTLQGQKLKVLEDECNELRKKLIEKERDIERLETELSLTQKRSKTVQKSKSLDLDQQTLDLKRQLQVIEQEAAVLRTKVQNLENENEKLINENKRLQLLKGAKNLKIDKGIDKYIDQIAKLEIELEQAQETIKEMEEKMKTMKMVDLKTTPYKKFVERTPKKVSTLTSKDQLKTMVNDLESEIGEMIVVIKTSENEKIRLEEEIKRLKRENDVNEALNELRKLNKKFEDVQKELKDEKDVLDKEKLKTEDLNKALTKTKESLAKANDEKKKLKEMVDNYKEEHQRMLEEKNKLDEELSKLKSNLKNAAYKQDEITLLTQKMETLKLNLDNKEKELKELKVELNDKTKLIEELTEKANKLSKLEQQIMETEEKLKKSEKQKKEKIKDLENKLKEEKDKFNTNSSKWEDDKKKFNTQLEEMNNKIATMETTIESKKKLIEHLENNLKKERELATKVNKKGSEDDKEVNRLKDELLKSKQHLKEIEAKLETSQKAQKNLEEKLKKTENENKTNKLNNEKRTQELETQLLNERKKIEVIKANQEKENKNKELELTTLKNKIKALEINGQETKKVTEIKQFQDRIEKLETTLAKEKQKYDELTSKYEILEEEHVVTKAKLVMEKETLESQLLSLKREFQDVESELKALRETYNTKQDAWIKEKLTMQEKIKEIERRSINGNDLEKTRFRTLLEEKQSELDQLKKENEAMNEQMEFMRKECDELRKKLDDYEKVNKVQRNISADSSAMEKEMRQLRAKLNTAEKARKSDLAECKMRYDSQLSIVNGEIQSLQSQVLRFKRERDNYKHMLESAQKTIGDLKNSPKIPKDNSAPLHYDELEEAKTKIATLEQQISCMEDELSEARLESSRLKTELVSERSSWEVKMSELHSRVNELEEEKILNSGRTKVAGLRTKMELAWQKEREEQQRLLQETATLARDLRQTLFEVERERDKERLESKRKQEQFKKTSEEDQDENKRKITELQCDLLELRDAHAKLRTTNEKLRREKERYEKEREEYKLIISGKKRLNFDEERKINKLIEQIDILKQLAPELFFSKNKEAPYTPTPPRRTRGSKSRETSPAIDRRESSLSPEDKQEKIQNLMQHLVATSEELRKNQKLTEDEYERERIKRSMGMRRATSTETECDTNRFSKPLMRNTKTTSSLHRKSLSLEHTIQNNESKIWKNDDSMSSLTSIDNQSDVERWSKRDTSLDSRLSGGSTQSDFIGEKKKKKGIISKLKKLTKSRSIDDEDPGTFSPTRQLSSKPNSSSEVNEDKGSKSNIKERITGMFKRAGSSSRSNSLERKNEVRHETSSTQRPLVRNGSNGNFNRASPSFNR